MALIRCPNCETMHDVPADFFAAGPRKVRCATCREVWESTGSESTANGLGAILTGLAPAGRDAAVPPTLDDAPLAAEAPAGQDDIDALFAEAAPEAPESSPPDAVAAAEAAPPPASEPEAPAGPIFLPPEAARAEPEAPRRGRRANRDREAVAPPRKKGSMAVVLMAAGFGTLASLAIFRHETVRLAPEAAPVYEKLGLAASPNRLDIRDVRSRLVEEAGRETLEVVGQIINLASDPQNIPVLRLAVRNKDGQELYVWTATAEQLQVDPGASTSFRRRLASPPKDAHSVLVRFVGPHDAVSALR